MKAIQLELRRGEGGRNVVCAEGLRGGGGAGRLCELGWEVLDGFGPQLLLDCLDGIAKVLNRFATGASGCSSWSVGIVPDWSGTI